MGGVSSKDPLGDKILIAPGRRVSKGAKSDWIPIKTEIIGIKGGGLALDSIHAGGLCGISTPLDPMITKADDLSGQVMAREGELPPVWEELRIDLVLLDAMVSSSGEEPEKVRPLQSGEMLMLNSATATSVGTVSQIKGKNATIKLRLPICAEVGSRITLSRRIGSRWRLIGHASIKE